MKINKFPKYIFWSYKKDADLPVSVIVKNVILYGDIKQMVLLTKLVGKREILKSIEKLSAAKRAKKRINFIEKVIL